MYFAPVVHFVRSSESSKTEDLTLLLVHTFTFYVILVLHISFQWFQFSKKFSIAGWNGILAQQQGKQYQEETVDIPPGAQAMYK